MLRERLEELLLFFFPNRELFPFKNSGIFGGGLFLIFERLLFLPNKEARGRELLLVDSRGIAAEPAAALRLRGGGLL